MNKKADMQILPQEVVKLIIALVCIIFLIFLAVKFYSLFALRTKIEQAKAAADLVIAKASEMEEDNLNQTKMIFNAPINYNLFCSFNLKCGGKFCLCFSPNFDLSSATCRQTEYWFLIRDKDKKLSPIQISMIFDLIIKVNKYDREVYVINKYDDYDKLRNDYIHPLFFKYNNIEKKWQWSICLEKWVDLSKRKTDEAGCDYNLLSLNTDLLRDFENKIKNLNIGEDAEEAGKEFLISSGARDSSVVFELIPEVEN